MYTVYIMAQAKPGTTVLTIRVPRSLDRRLAAEARRRRQTRSEAARAILESALAAAVHDPVKEARRQSLLASRQDGQVRLLAAVTKDLAGQIHAGKLVGQIAPIVGGKGGGRPELAQAGGSDPSKIGEALARAVELVSA